MNGDVDTDTSDVSLIERARSGDSRAFGQLWDRHHPAALRFAQRLADRTDAEDLVSEAFTSIFQALRNGVGPDEFFRPYLYTTLKNLSIRWSIRDSQLTYEDVDFDQLADRASAEEMAVERSTEAAAFRSLPVRWQEILWYGEVEGLKPREIAPIMGMSANSVAALAYRAREGFRRAWVEEQLRNGLPEERSSDEALVGRLRLVLVPLLVGVPAHELLRTSSVGPAHAASAASTVSAAGASGGGAAAPVMGTIAAALVVGAAGAVIAGSLTLGGGANDTATHPTTPGPVWIDASGRGLGADPVAPAHALSSASIARAPIVDPPRESVSQPPALPVPPGSSPDQSAPVDDPPPPSSAPPLLPATIPVVLSPVMGQILPTSAFAVSGAGTGGSWVTIAVDGVVSGVERVGDDARWSHTVSLPLDDGYHELTAVQHSDERSPSTATTIGFVLDSVAPLAPTVTSTIDRYTPYPPSLAGTAEPGAIVTISSGALELVRTTANAAGEWTGTLVGVQPTDESVLVRQIDAAGHESAPQVFAVSFAPRFDPAAPSSVAYNTLGALSASGWPGASVRTTINGTAVLFSGRDTQTIGADGTFVAYHLVPGLPPGDYELGVAYVDPETGEPGSPELFSLTVTP